LLLQKIGKTIVKTRYILENEDTSLFKEIIIDHYNSLKFGLVISEVEYIDESFVDQVPNILKEYILKEVSSDKNYSNKYISLN
jgi:CYTH domain-containing protein